MRADGCMEAIRRAQSVLLGQEGHKPTTGHCAPCPDVGGTEGPFKYEKVTAVVQHCGQDEAKSIQTTTCPEVKVCRSFVSAPFPYVDRLKSAKAYVDKAVKLHKVFSIQGPYPVVRAALRERGWIERRINWSKKQVHRRQSEESRASDSDDYDDNSDDVEKEHGHEGLHNLMSRMVRNEMVYFYWTNRRDAISTNLHKEQITNHFAKAGSFTTKSGLCVNLRNLHWFDAADPDTFFPRCYRLAAQDEKHAFIEDYRRTACISLLKYIVGMDTDVEENNTYHKTVKGQRKQRKCKSRPMDLSQMINSALKVCQEFLDSLEHNDIDISLETPKALTEEEWADFIHSYYLVVHGGVEIGSSEYFVACCKAMLQKLQRVSPQLDIDGTHNMWIVKPGAKSRGRGIKTVKHLDQILALVDCDPTLITDSKWVVQKYLECPMLVHGTKFDVRQWFLVTDWNPLTVWFYKKCYLRFSTQPYSLDSLDSSVHLCNNSIQKHLRPSQQRHPGIPADNMWSDDQFRTFLSKQGRKAQWEAVVVPGMKKAVIHAVQTAQDLVDSRNNTFELYGADFMLDCDLHPWLIEINASPTMASSTPVTARLCTAVQKDTLRVILDRRASRTADTGDFQLIYKQGAVEVPQYVGVSLLVEGFAAKAPCPLPAVRSSNHSAPKHRGPIKEKDPAAEKVKPLPKMVLKRMETQLKNTNCGILPRLHEPPVPVPIETVTLHLPTSVNKSICLPACDQPQSVLLWKRRAEISKVCSDKVQLFTTDKHQALSLPLGITALKQSRQTVTSSSSAKKYSNGGLLT